MLNKAQVIGIAKACTVAFMKARISSVVWCREKKKNIKLYIGDPISNGLHEKVMICYIMMLYY